MKIRIEYDYFGNYYRATTYTGKGCFVGLSEISFEEAKKELIENLAKIKEKGELPEPEEIEI